MISYPPLPRKMSLHPPQEFFRMWLVVIGSLIANMIMGIIILKKRYDLSKYMSVFMISMGIVICTIVSGTDVKENPSEIPKSESNFSVFFWWTLGILLLSAALMISACMGIYQEILYKRFGKHPREALFYTHLLPLPGFLLIFGNVFQHWNFALSSPAMSVPLISIFQLNMQIPSTLFYLIGNVLTQYICISSVYVLTTECTSLTVTLIVTLRKFVSLLFSIIYFKNEFTFYHWAGTILVFIGTIIFTELVPKSLVAQKKKIA